MILSKVAYDWGDKTTLNKAFSNMKLLSHPFGEYATHCYLIQAPEGQIIIDPGKGALEWVLENCSNPLAILNTHGHFDHVWSNHTLKERFPNTPLVIPKEDAFMLASDCFGTGLTPSIPDLLVEGERAELEFRGIKVLYRHFPGHTPGCSTIEIGEWMFSGDFIFKSSIGRSDFPYSSSELMRESLERFGALTYDKPLFPGHGESSTIAKEQKNLSFWLSRL